MILRTHRRTGFVILPNSTLQDDRLTWEARGLLGYLVSLPDDWQVRVTELVRRGPCGYQKLKRIIAELERAGYIVRGQKRNKNGQFCDWVFDVYDEPQPGAECAVLPHSANPNSAQPDSAGRNLQRTQRNKVPKKQNTTRAERAAAPAGAGGGVDAELRGLDERQRSGVAAALHGLDAQQRADVIAVLRRILERGEVRSSVIGLARELAARARDGALELPGEVVAYRQAEAIEAEVRRIEQAVGHGAQVMLAGEPAELRDGYLLAASGSMSLRCALSRELVEVVRDAA